MPDSNIVTTHQPDATDTTRPAPTATTPGTAPSATAPATTAGDVSTTSLPLLTATIRPWRDPVVDEAGHDPRSRYVETFWLGILGPTATWLIRRLVAGLDQAPDGYELDLDATARAMGLRYSVGRSSPFSKALQRCVMFGLAHPLDSGLAVRRRLPSISHRHLRRMPDAVQHAHADWERTTISLDELSRAHRLATVLLDAGDENVLIEHRLIALGVRDAIAAEVADNALRLDT